MTKNLTKAIFLAVFLFIFAIFAFSHDMLSPMPPGMPAGGGETIVPESERFLSFVVIGVWPDSGDYYFLPLIKNTKNAHVSEYEQLDKEFYWLNFEISHGAIMRNLPEYTHVFVAIPDKHKVEGASGREGEYFKDYLRTRCKWKEERIQNHIHFFIVPSSLNWAQDTSEPIGVDKKGRILIAADPGNYNNSFAIVNSMADTYPDYFKVVKLDRTLSSEGGDMEVVLSPDKKGAVFLIGRNRVNNFYQRTKGLPLKGISFSQEMIDDVKKAYSDSLFGMKVEVVPEKMLLFPELAADEIFHLDMSVVIMSSGKGVDAFVPTYDNPEVKLDLVSGNKFSAGTIKGWQAEYDEIASELRQRGYNVMRLPFADHPVRSPANLVKYKDRETGKSCVLLGKYPYLSGNDQNAPQAKMNAAFGLLSIAEKEWEKSYDPAGFKSLKNRADALWDAMDYSAAAKNRIFEKQMEIFQKAGYTVIPVAEYAWGAGGLHCDLQF
jgi:hypothetical protein